jgi:sulfate adenylyltransferase subunit 1
LEDDIDVSRGDMIAKKNNSPEVSQDIDAMICWLGNKPTQLGSKYTIRHTSNESKAIVKELVYKIDIQTLQRLENETALNANDIARIKLRTTTPILYDSYRRNRATGSFILIEEGTNNTVAAGMII